MDESSLPPPARAPRAVFGPDRRLTVATAALSAGAVWAAVAAAEPTGTLLFALAAAALAAHAASDLVWWPRLAIGPAGLVVRSPWARARLEWSEVDAVRVDVHHRHGLRSVALEIESGERLIVLTRRGLGTEPERAAELIAAFGRRR